MIKTYDIQVKKGKYGEQTPRRDNLEYQNGDILSRNGSFTGMADFNKNYSFDHAESMMCVRQALKNVSHKRVIKSLYFGNNSQERILEKG